MLVENSNWLTRQFLLNKQFTVNCPSAVPFFLPLLLPDVGEKVATKFSKVLVNKIFFSSRKVLSNIYVSKMLARGVQLFLDVVGKKSRYNRPWQVGLVDTIL